MRRGATALVTITNDAWYGDTAAPGSTSAPRASAPPRTTAPCCARRSRECRLDRARRRGRARRSSRGRSRDPARWCRSPRAQPVLRARPGWCRRSVWPSGGAFGSRCGRADACAAPAAANPQRPALSSLRTPSSASILARPRSNLGGIFEGAKASRRLAEIDRRCRTPGFWSRPAENAPLLQQRRALRAAARRKRLRTDAEELATWRELLAEDEADAERDRCVRRPPRPDLDRSSWSSSSRAETTRSNASWRTIPAPAAPSRRTGPRCCCACTCAGPSSHGYRPRSSTAGRRGGGHQERHHRGAGRLRLRLPEAARRRPPPGAHQPFDAADAPPHLVRLGRRLPGDRRRRSRSTSTTRTCASTPTARRARAASTSTRPTPRCASPTCRPASSWPARTSAASTRTARWR